MGRLIEVPSVHDLPPEFMIQVGDLLLFKASGGRVRSGTGVVESLGAFNTSTLTADGRILSPMGGPNTVVFLARRLGQARIEVITGDPWHGPQRSAVLDLLVGS